MRARLQAYGLDPLGNSAEAARSRYDAGLPVAERLVKISGARAD